MEKFDLITPVVLIIFNRPDTTQQVFEEIRKAKPSRLFLIADGPRVHKPNDMEKCLQTREIVSHIDWKCEVHTNFSDTNLGCKERISSGIDWVFNNTEEAIILEDDCLPHPTFFRYCQELLLEYKHDERIMVISGDNFQFGKQRTEYSYYFSKYTHTTGWATWKRAWKHFDKDIKLWPKLRDENWLFDILQDESAVEYWNYHFENTYNGEINAWDYQWLFNCWSQNGLTILPNVNLISNLGYGNEATNTFDHSSLLANIPIKEMKFPLHNPSYIMKDLKSDQYTDYIFYGIKTAEYYNELNICSNYKKIWEERLVEGTGSTGYLRNRGIQQVCIFGTGLIGQTLLQDLRLVGINVVAFLDRDLNKQGTRIKEIPVRGIEWLSETNETIHSVIVTIESLHDRAIQNYLNEQLKGKDIFIMSWKDLFAYI